MTILQSRSFTCWAASSQDCGLGPSREHIVSNGLFPERVVHVSGFEWCKGETRSVGVNAIARQILCRKHNSALSDLDAEAIKAMTFFQRSEPPASVGPAGSNHVDGHKLERWLLKTAINVAYGDNLHLGVGMAGSQPGRPSPYLVDVALGKRQFEAKMGAYFLFPDGETRHDPHEIVLVPLVKEGCVGGFYFELRSQAVFLSLLPGHAPPKLSALARLDLQEGLLNAQLVFRPPMIAREGLHKSALDVLVELTR